MTDLDTLTRQVERSSNKEIRLPKPTVLALLDVARAAEALYEDDQYDPKSWGLLGAALAKMGEQA